MTSTLTSHSPTVEGSDEETLTGTLRGPPLPLRRTAGQDGTDEDAPVTGPLMPSTILMSTSLVAIVIRRVSGRAGGHGDRRRPDDVAGTRRTPSRQASAGMSLV